MDVTSAHTLEGVCGTPRASVSGCGMLIFPCQNVTGSRVYRRFALIDVTVENAARKFGIP